MARKWHRRLRGLERPVFLVEWLDGTRRFFRPQREWELERCRRTRDKEPEESAYFLEHGHFPPWREITYRYQHASAHLSVDRQTVAELDAAQIAESQTPRGRQLLHLREVEQRLFFDPVPEMLLGEWVPPEEEHG